MLARLIGSIVQRLGPRAQALWHRVYYTLPRPHEELGTIDRIGFLLHTPELVNHYKCVWEVLPDDSFDIVVSHPMADIPAEYRPWQQRIVSAASVLAAKKRYRYLVSNHPIHYGKKPLIVDLGEINVRFMYAAGKSGWNLREWNTLYDVIMCFGPYHAEQFSRVCGARVVQMGYPRFDRYFTTPLDKAAALARLGCDPAKKTVVWLPTWGKLSSVGWFDAEISALTAEWNVVVKVHPLMPGREPEKLKALERHRFTTLITDASDNMPLYQLADFMLFDYGGPPFAGVYSDKDMLLLNVPGAESDELTGGGSPDIEIRKHLVSVNPGEEAVARALAADGVWESQRESRRQLRDTYFAPYFGTSAKRAAEILLGLGDLGLSPGSGPRIEKGQQKW